jgi:hypothetical protein
VALISASPRRRGPLTDDHLAAWLAGRLGSQTHLHAVERARSILEMPVPVSMGGSDRLWQVANGPFGLTLAKLFRASRQGSPIEVVTVSIASTHSEAILHLRVVSMDPSACDEGRYRWVPLGLPLAPTARSFSTINTISGAAFRALATLASDTEPRPLASTHDSLPASTGSVLGRSLQSPSGIADLAAAPGREAPGDRGDPSNRPPAPAAEPPGQSDHDDEDRDGDR